MLERVNKHANTLSKRQQETVFRLLQRSIQNENVLEVLHEVAKLSDDDIDRLRELLKDAPLESIITLSARATNRLKFLDYLHEMVYGDQAKHLKERAQLHRIIETNCWIFGQRFHLATSDQNFRNIIERHRRLAGLAKIETDPLKGIAGADDIPDLFLATKRESSSYPKQGHLLVELKAPRVTLRRKETEQIRRYAQTILESSEFDKKSTHWDLILVSSIASEEIERDRNQKDKPPGCLWEWDNMTVWAFEWSEIITRARAEMYFVRQCFNKSLTH